MYPRPFAYLRAESVEHAAATLAEHRGEAMILAGGATIIPLMKYRLRSPRLLVDIGGLADELRFVEETPDGHVRVGALVRHADAEDDPVMRAQPLLAEVAATIADRQVRNMGTVAGGVCAVEPTGDWVPAFLALRGTVMAQSPRGRREIPSDQFVVGAHTSALEPDEVVTEVRFPVEGPRSGSAHEKLTIRANAGIVNCSAAVTVDDEGAISSVGIAVGALRPHPIRATVAEELLTGSRLEGDLLDRVARDALDGVDAVSDARGSGDHRRAAAMVMLKRAVARAYAGAVAAVTP
ncbi:MAG TPA: xanthine dehydrogenase family protein subunit M [Acidimicrobiia bacterium]